MDNKEKKMGEHGYWMYKDGTSYWGMALVYTAKINRQIHEMKKNLKKCLFYAVDYKISK